MGSEKFVVIQRARTERELRVADPNLSLSRWKDPGQERSTVATKGVRTPIQPPGLFLLLQASSISLLIEQGSWGHLVNLSPEIFLKEGLDVVEEMTDLQR